MGRIVSLPDGGPTTIEHYEAALAPIYAWIDAVAQRVGPGVGRTLHGSSVRGWQALRSRDCASARRRLPSRRSCLRSTGPGSAR